MKIKFLKENKYLAAIGNSLYLSENNPKILPFREFGFLPHAAEAPKTVEMRSEGWTGTINIRDRNGNNFEGTWNTAGRKSKVTIDDRNADPEKEYIITPSVRDIFYWVGTTPSEIIVKNKELPVCIKIWGFWYGYAAKVDCETYY